MARSYGFLVLAILLVLSKIEKINKIRGNVPPLSHLWLTKPYDHRNLQLNLRQRRSSSLVQHSALPSQHRHILLAHKTQDNGESSVE